MSQGSPLRDENDSTNNNLLPKERSYEIPAFCSGFYRAFRMVPVVLVVLVALAAVVPAALGAPGDPDLEPCTRALLLPKIGANGTLLR